MHRNKNKGLALITVLLVIAVVTILTSDMAMRLQMQIQRSINLQSNEQAYWYAIGAEEFVRLVLKETYDTDDGVFNLEQPWAMDEMVFPLEDGEIAGKVEDLHACFNINAVYKEPSSDNNSQQEEENDNDNNNNEEDEESGTTPGESNVPNASQFKVTPKEQFMALLEAINIENYQAEQISDSTFDWLDPDSNTSPFGAEDYIYEARLQPHLAANSTMVDVSEVRMIEGVNKKIMDELLPFICVIPDEKELLVNVNTLTEEKAEILHAMLAPKLSLDDARSVISSRPSGGYKNINDFWQEAEISAIGAVSPEVKKQFTVKSQYFKMKAKTEFNRSWIGLESTFVLDQKGQSKVIARKIGV